MNKGTGHLEFSESEELYVFSDTYTNCSGSVTIIYEVDFDREPCIFLPVLYIRHSFYTNFFKGKLQPKGQHSHLPHSGSFQKTIILRT